MQPFDPDTGSPKLRAGLCLRPVAPAELNRQSGNDPSESELLSEIHFANMLILQNFVRRASGNQVALIQYIGSHANSEGFPDIMVGNEDTDVPIA